MEKKYNIKSRLGGQKIYYKKVLLRKFKRNSILQEETGSWYPVIRLKINYFTRCSQIFSIIKDCLSIAAAYTCSEILIPSTAAVD